MTKNKILQYLKNLSEKYKRFMKRQKEIQHKTKELAEEAYKESDEQKIKKIKDTINKY